jgi:hypothetical protein
MGVLLWRVPRRFFLLMGIYLVQVWFFVQYRAFDIDVFFIPAHFVFAILIGGGIYGLLRGVASLGQGGAAPRRALATAATVGLALFVALGLVGEVRANWAANDYSGDTAINDFYENAFALLPRDSALLGRGGVFGYDMFYFRLVYGYRPDVAMPMIDGPRPAPRELAGRAIYTTEPGGGRGGGGPWSPPPGLVAGDSWSVPVLLGQGSVGVIALGDARMQGRPLVLYGVQERPPDLIVDEAEPDVVVERSLGGLELVGYDLDSGLATPGGRLHLRLYWRADAAPRALVGTWLGDTSLEAHELGLGNLARYVREVRPLDSGVVVEDYWVVLPSTLALEDYPLEVGLVAPWAGGEEAVSRLKLGTIALDEASAGLE